MVNWKNIKKYRKIKNWLNFLILILLGIHFSIFYYKRLVKDEISNMKKTITAKSGLKLREAPNGKAVLTIPFNHQVQIIDSNNNYDWIRVSYNNSVGYVKKDYLN